MFLFIVLLCAETAELIIPYYKNTIKCTKYVRHADHHEIQPIPWISKECKRSNTETSRQHFGCCLEGVNSSKNIPKKENEHEFLKNKISSATTVAVK